MAQELPDHCQRLLRLQRGVIASWQTEPAGLNPRRVESLVRDGHWQRLHYGVYATFTGEPPRSAVLWAAVLRAGRNSILSHETAAELDGLIDKRSRLIHVTVLNTRRPKPIAGLVIHGTERLLEVRGPGLPPRTVIEETVLDLAQNATSFDDVVALLTRACQRRLTFPWMLRERVDMRAKLRWRADILQALEDVADGVHSVLEYRYIRDVERAHRLPVAERQVHAVQDGGAIYRDVFYRQYGVIVELDGKASHVDRRPQDNRRDNAAAAHDVLTLRYGWADVTERSCPTAYEVAQTLIARGWPGSLRPCRRCRDRFS